MIFIINIKKNTHKSSFVDFIKKIVINYGDRENEFFNLFSVFVEIKKKKFNKLKNSQF